MDVLGKVKRNSLRWLDLMERIEGQRLTKKIYESEMEKRKKRGKPRMRRR